jgi:hypothetical protein
MIKGRKVIDILLGADEDLLVAAGDFVTGEATAQNQVELLWTGPGDWKEQPTAGVAVATYTDDEGKSALVKAIVREFMGDGMEVENLQRNSDTLSDSTVRPFINAYYI